MSRGASRAVALAFLLGLVAAVWIVAAWLLGKNNGTSNGLSLVTSNNHFPVERLGPDGVRYSVDAASAVYRLEMRPEDRHSQRVFPTYGAALHYAGEQNLPTMPSVAMILATCSAGDDRLHAALELALDHDPQTGRRELLRQWLATVIERRQLASPQARPAYDIAANHLAAAVMLQGDEPQLPPDLKRSPVSSNSNDPPLGPWAATAELGMIWARDRFLANNLDVRGDDSAAAIAVLARSMTAADTLAAGWQKQLAVSRVLYGCQTRATLETVAARLAQIPDNEITGPQSVALVRAALADEWFAPVPAALAMAMTPEEAVLRPLQMKAWDDPTGALVAAIRSGALALEPGPDDGFYQHRWHALETLAAPAKAPEALKLQLSADYQRRWQRAFAAAFTEGRASFVKRLPIQVMGMKSNGDIPVDVAPQFSAEPAPIVYLRLARAYRTLERGLATALGGEAWRQLCDANGNPLHVDLHQRQEVLYGLAGLLYREVGYTLPLLDNELPRDFVAAETAARAWLAALKSNPDVQADARVLVTLASDGCGSYRCPAILGVRLEPVEYSWVEEPDVSSQVAARFVPARYWLAAPVPATITVNKIPSPAEFRKRCDGHADVAALCRAFGEKPAVLRASARIPWSWLGGGALLLGGGYLVARWWRHCARRTRKQVLAVLAAGCATLVVIAVFFPPVWLLRLAWVHAVTSKDRLALLAERWFPKWSANRQTALLISLLRDPDPQVRYCGAMLPLLAPGPETPALTPRPQFAADELALLRTSIRDEVPEVQWAAWMLLCERGDQELPFLLGDLERTAAPENLHGPLAELRAYHPRHPAVIAAVLKLASSPRADIRAATISCLAGWRPVTPAINEALRAASRDPAAEVRRQSAYALERNCGTEELACLLDLWLDESRPVRIAGFRAVSQCIQDTGCSRAPNQALCWENESIQQALIQYAGSARADFEERLGAARWIADPDALRDVCRKLLPDAGCLPTAHSRSGPFRHTRNQALALLAARWLLAGQADRLTPTGSPENTDGLEYQPGLLEKLVRCMAENRTQADALTVLQEAATGTPTEQRCATRLLQQLDHAHEPLRSR